MAEEKTYLNVPFAEKDAAKALGARWDPEKKKWYVPPTKDVTLFAKWHIEAADLKEPVKSTGKTTSTTSGNASSGIITYPTDPNFVAYDGDEPPWL